MLVQHGRDSRKMEICCGIEKNVGISIKNRKLYLHFSVLYDVYAHNNE